MNQHRIDPRLTQHQLIHRPTAVEQQQRATLIRVELGRGAFVHRPAHELAEVARAEPDLGFQEESAELAVVADENGGFERRMPLG